MVRSSKNDIQHRADEIKQLILSGQPFAKMLAQLYTELRLQACYNQMIATYRLLLLYTDKKQTIHLYHPALLQAFIQNGQTREALKVGKVLLHQNPHDPETLKLMKSLQLHKEGHLPAYTSLTRLSRYTLYIKPNKQNSKTNDLIHTLKGRLQAITPQKLEELNYYEKRKQLNTVPQPYRTAVQENFDEFLICYLLGLERSVVGVAGTLLEMLLSIHLYRENKQKKYLINKQHKQVFELSLNELLCIYHQQKLLPKSVLNLCRAARTQRNFIHPGKEVLEKERLTAGGVQICFLAVMETIDALL